MAFAQLTFRESLRDIETCLRAQQAKLYHLGIRGRVSRSTLADGNETRDWRIYHDFAMSLIGAARKLYAGDGFGVEMANTAYALDTTTIDLCLSLFPWARFRQTKAAVRLHTLLDLRGNIPSFVHLSHGKMHEVNVLDHLVFEAGSFYVMDRGFTDFVRLYSMHLAQSFFVIRAKSNMQCRRVYSHPVDKSTGLRCDQTIRLTGVSAGSATVTLSVTDGTNPAVTMPFTVTVVANAPPNVAPIGPQALGPGEARDVPYTASDPEGNPLTATASSDNPGVVAAAVNVPGMIALNAVGAGSATVTLSVTDGVNPAVTTSFAVTVSAPNMPPNVAPIGPQALGSGEARDVP